MSFCISFQCKCSIKYKLMLTPVKRQVSVYFWPVLYLNLHVTSTNHREGLCEILKRLIPSSLAAWKILPSTSMLTALVHSSSKANWGLEIIIKRNQKTLFYLGNCLLRVKCTLLYNGSWTLCKVLCELAVRLLRNQAQNHHL